MFLSSFLLKRNLFIRIETLDISYNYYLDVLKGTDPQPVMGLYKI